MTTEGGNRSQGISTYLQQEQLQTTTKNRTLVNEAT